MKFDTVIDTDHRSFLIDINLQQYFQEEFSKWDTINKCVINPNRRSYREKFKQFADEMLDMILLKRTIDEIEQITPSKECLE